MRIIGNWKGKGKVGVSRKKERRKKRRRNRENNMEVRKKRGSKKRRGRKEKAVSNLKIQSSRAYLSGSGG